MNFISNSLIFISWRGTLPAVADFRYPQFCALARAAEVVGERWTILIVRDLMVGPQRFSDLKRRLHCVSPSVLSERLAQLEERGVVERSRLGPPAGATVYALTAAGQALAPALQELTKWGARFLLPPHPGDHLEPSWVVSGLTAFARRRASAPCRVQIQVPDGDIEHSVHVRAGSRGTFVTRKRATAELEIRVEAMTLLGLLTGLIQASDALKDGRLEAQGDFQILGRLPELFEFDMGFPPTVRGSDGSTQPEGNLQ